MGNFSEILKDWRLYSSIAFIGGAVGLFISVILLRVEDKRRHSVNAMAQVLLKYKFGVLDIEGDINKIRCRILLTPVLTSALAFVAVVPAFALAQSWAMPAWLYASAGFVGFLCLASVWLSAKRIATYVVRRPVRPEEL